MGYGMKYKKGLGFPFKTGDKLPLDADGKERTMPNLAIHDDAFEQAVNTYDTKRPNVKQIAEQTKDVEKTNKFYGEDND